MEDAKQEHAERKNLERDLRKRLLARNFGHVPAMWIVMVTFVEFDGCMATVRNLAADDTYGKTCFMHTAAAKHGITLTEFANVHLRSPERLGSSLTATCIFARFHRGEFLPPLKPKLRLEPAPPRSFRCA
jgi:hypothetical protein